MYCGMWISIEEIEYVQNVTPGTSEMNSTIFSFVHFLQPRETKSYLNGTEIDQMLLNFNLYLTRATKIFYWNWNTLSATLTQNLHNQDMMDHIHIYINQTICISYPTVKTCLLYCNILHTLFMNAPSVHNNLNYCILLKCIMHQYMAHVQMCVCVYVLVCVCTCTALLARTWVYIHTNIPSSFCIPRSYTLVLGMIVA